MLTAYAISTVVMCHSIYSISKEISLHCFWLLFLFQCLNLSEEELSIREVDFIDIVNDPLDPKHYKVEEVSLGYFPL